MTLLLLTPGLHTRVVDAGRPRSRSLGVPIGGAADCLSLALGNALVGNPPDTAALEITLSGPTLRCDVPLGIAVLGAPFDLGPYPPNSAFTLAAGQEWRIGGTSSGARAYVCFAGGIEAPLILGSRSSMGALKAGDSLIVHEGRASARSIAWWNPPAELRALPGSHAAMFPEGRFFAGHYRVSASADRMGVRLEGPALPVPGELPSEPACPGAVQVTRDGQCIILGVDGQTIGGYPKIAQVIAADLDAVGQLRPGQGITFRLVDEEEAMRAWEQREALLRWWLTRLGGES